MKSRSKSRKRRLKDIAGEALAATVAAAVWGAVCGWLLLPCAALDYILGGNLEH